MIHVGVLSPVTGGFYYGEVIAGVVQEVAAAGGRVTLVQTLDAGRAREEVSVAPDALPIGWDAFDGLLSIAHAASDDHLRSIRAAGKRLVVISNDLTIDAASVGADNHQGVQASVDHLAGHGHRRIAFVGNLTQPDTRARYEAYRAGLATNGIEHDDRLFFATADHIEAGGRDAAPRLAADRSITAVICTTDRVALGLMAGLTALGRTVPDDIAVIGFDDVEAGWRSAPPLATVNQRVGDLGARAAALLLAEIRGEAVERRRHTVPASFLPRGSCGCVDSTHGRTSNGSQDAGVLVAALTAHLHTLAGTTPGTDAARSSGPADLGDDDGLDAVIQETLAVLDDQGRLDAVIHETLAALYPVPPSPETVDAFSEALVEEVLGLAAALEAAGRPGADVLRRSIARTMVVLRRQEMAVGLLRTEHLSSAVVEQYDVGIEVLGRDGDPAGLSWLDRASTPLGCLGVWDGPPGAGRLRIVGVYDPDRRLTGALPVETHVTQFPPRALIDAADPARDEVTIVVPVRGSSGDHGLLCVIGVAESGFGSDRATYNHWATTYNHWAAVLGVALKQRRLLEDVRRSEERYSLAAAATEDGLWDWDVDAGHGYFSDRCAALGVTTTDPRRRARGVDPELAPWTEAVHPDDLPGLRAALHAAVERRVSFELEHRLRAADGSYRWVLCRGLPVGEPGSSARRVVGSLSDIHTRKELEERLREGALYDPLTGLPNRRMFLERLAQAVDASRGGRGTPFAVLFLDLDGFKLINDSLGHLMGDELLRTVASRLQGDLRALDTAARLGGDEFAVLLSGLQREAVLRIAARIQERVAEPVPLGGHEVFVTASVGITSSDSGYTDGQDVLRDADIAMYHAKEAERGTASEFEPEMHSRATDRLRAQGELRTALLQEQFVVHYQPLVALDGGGLCQFEALVRWQHPNRGLLLPGDFLPVMVETGTIVPLGEWVIDAVCAQVAEWRTTTPGAVEVSVNLSHREFWSDKLLVTVTQSLLRHAVPPRCLVLEITESVIMADPHAAQQIMADLRAAGVRLHIDDFGTGHSSLHALRAFPVDAFKIDQSFVQQLGIDRQTTELVRIIVAMGRTLGLAVVAEGVETAEQAAQLAAMGCETVQGWLYAKALPGAEAAALLGTRLAGGSATAAAAASAARSVRSVSEALGGAVSEAVDGAFGGSVAAVGL